MYACDQREARNKHHACDHIFFFFGVGFVAHEHKFFISRRNPLISKLVNHNRKIMFNKENKECVLYRDLCIVT